MHLISYLRQAIMAFANSQNVSEKLLSKIVVESCKDPNHGHFASNAALVCAKSIGKNPREFAENLKSVLLANSDLEIQSIDIAGPGFVNMTLKSEALLNVLKLLTENGPREGINKSGAGKSANIEFVSANPTGPLHIGHGRNAVFGDVISSLYQAIGYKVTREYYINDAGSQIKALAKSVHLRLLELQGETIEDNHFGPDMYRGDYLIPAAKAILKDQKNILKELEGELLLHALEEKVVIAMIENIKHDLSLLGVVMDEYTSERALANAGVIKKTITDLKSKGTAFMGKLPKPKGIDVDKWESEEQLLFATKAHGDDEDRVLIKSNGAHTYFAGDVTYHHDKIKRGYDLILNIFGFDHSGYLKRIKAAVHGMKADQKFDIKVTQMVNFMDDGKPLKMSKRAGTFVTLKDLVEKVGKSITRFIMVSRHHDMPIDFDFAQVVEQTPENPLFYIYYANARIHSVLKHAAELSMNPSLDNLDTLTSPEELEMIKILALWPQVIESAAHHMEPHRVTNYLHQLASAFHGLWNLGKDNLTMRFIDEKQPQLTVSRLTLITAISETIEDGLTLLGIDTVRELR